MVTGPRAVLFDFDGLICDTEHAAFTSWRDLYASFGLEFPPEVWSRLMGRPDGERTGLADLARRLGRPVSRAVREDRRRRKRELCDREPLRPGVAAVLDEAARLGLATAVVSSSARAWVEHHLGRLGIETRFTELVTGEQVDRHKPAPDLYVLALRRLGLSAAEALAFEDSATGVRAARAAGVRCVGVPNAVGCAGDLTLAGADTVVPDLTKLDLGLLGTGAGLERKAAS